MIYLPLPPNFLKYIIISLFLKLVTKIKVFLRDFFLSLPDTNLDSYQRLYLEENKHQICSISKIFPSQSLLFYVSILIILFVFLSVKLLNQGVFCFSSFSKAYNAVNELSFKIKIKFNFDHANYTIINLLCIYVIHCFLSQFFGGKILKKKYFNFLDS